MQVSEFDSWASSFVEGIDNVKRDIWDVFARHKFINWLITEGDIVKVDSANGTILLIETEVKSSGIYSEAEEKTSVLSTSNAESETA